MNKKLNRVIILILSIVLVVLTSAAYLGCKLYSEQDVSQSAAVQSITLSEDANSSAPSPAAANPHSLAAEPSFTSEEIGYRKILGISLGVCCGLLTFSFIVLSTFRKM
ncbi:MAG: hypothetical protein IKV41_01930 [Oscillospiraceae bacterium]|nr:hypothetical protein [Oscillospiraceae bacterium]